MRAMGDGLEILKFSSVTRSTPEMLPLLLTIRQTGGLCASTDSKCTSVLHIPGPQWDHARIHDTPTKRP
ncbi:hypothetical protein TNCV_1577891 [Trichonephila clavipes]|nr:hypothetical protein TNCV_1577891 [Trichonephila clavipes]